jgi:uncharacterized protein (DUF433 family)
MNRVLILLSDGRRREPGHRSEEDYRSRGIVATGRLKGYERPNVGLAIRIDRVGAPANTQMVEGLSARGTNVRRGDRIMPGDLEIQEPASEGAPNRSRDAEVHTSNGLETTGPRLVHREGMAYVAGCDVPVWQLEMAHRAGSSPDALIGVFPSLTPEGLDLAFAYAQQHREGIDALFQELGPLEVSCEEEEDDEDEFQSDLDELFERDAELFRRLAQ